MEKNILKKDNSKIIKVGPSESMSKSKKNTIDPENIIQIMEQTAVRLFILSDSPPEKDVHGQMKELFLHLNLFKNYGFKIKNFR